MHVIQNLFRYMRAKNYCKSSWFNKVIAKTKWCSFLGHSVGWVFNVADLMVWPPYCLVIGSDHDDSCYLNGS